jgi:hypothetical protein
MVASQLPPRMSTEHSLPRCSPLCVLAQTLASSQAGGQERRLQVWRWQKP